jgi:anti-sigma B factor antagonist
MLSIGPDPADASRVVVKGRLDASQAAAAQAFLDTTGGVVTLDCAGVEHLASAGLGVLLKTHKRLLAGGGKLRLKAPSKHLRDILGYAGFDHLLEIEP